MELIVVRAGGFQGSLHFKHSKILGQSYSECPVLVPGLSSARPLGLAHRQGRVAPGNLWLTGHGSLEGTPKALNPFSSTPTIVRI